MVLIASLFLVDILFLTNTVLTFQNSWVIRAEKLFKKQLKLKLSSSPKG
jgi:hypothetical protein